MTQKYSKKKGKAKNVQKTPKMKITNLHCLNSSTSLAVQLPTLRNLPYCNGAELIQPSPSISHPRLLASSTEQGLWAVAATICPGTGTHNSLHHITSENNTKKTNSDHSQKPCHL